MRQPGTETNPLTYEDIPLAYLSTMVEYVTSYAYESAQDLEIRRFSFVKKAKRARISCEKINMYAAVAASKDHMVLLANTGAVGISRLIGCPILVRNCPSDRRCKHDLYGNNNQSVHIRAHEHRPSESKVG